MFAWLVALLLSYNVAGSHANGPWTCTDNPVKWQSGLLLCPPNSYLNGFLRSNIRQSDNKQCGTSDGNGVCMSSIIKMRCCKIASAVDMPWPATGPDGMTAVYDYFWWFNVNMLCSDGYFMAGLIIDATKDDQMAYQQMECVRPKGPVGSLSSYQLPIPGAYINPPTPGVWMTCPQWQYMTGMYNLDYDKNSNKNWDDVFDLGLNCAIAPDASCGGLPARANTTYGGDTTCIHQGCTVTQSCLPGYASTSMSGNITCSASVPAQNFQWSGTPLNCQDVNECNRACVSPAEKSNPLAYGCNTCDPSAICTNTLGELGGFNCNCNPGYSGDGHTCTPQQNCIRPCQSSQGETPESAPSNYPCNNCSANAICTEQNPWFTCACKTGYGPLPDCPDINECAKNCTGAPATDCNRCDSHAACTNTVGNYTCACGPGWNGTGTSCTDIDECSYPLCNGNNAPCYQCPYGTRCQNLPNGMYYQCVCATGFEPNAQNVCTNINECNTTLTCGNAACIDLSPGYACGPRFNFIAIDGTLLNSTTSYTLSSSRQLPAQIVTFNLQGVTGNFTWMAPVYYGDNQNPLRYSLSNCTAGSGGNYSCFMNPGTGKNLFFSIQYNSTLFAGTQVYSDTRLFSFPRPTLLPGTLRISANGNGSTALSIALIFGTPSVIYMNGTNLPSAKLDLAVVYGSSAYPCAVQATSPDVIACTVGTKRGTGMTFSLVAGHGAQAWTANGTDTLDLTSAGPSIMNLTGCTQFSATVVNNCPTTGRVPLTVTLDLDIVPPILMLVGGSSCLDPKMLTNRTFTCTLPPGAGTDLLVTVGQQDVFSPAQPLLSYIKPTVDGLYSDACTQVPDVYHLQDCPFTNPSNTLLTIRGKDFGPAPTILIGSNFFLTTPTSCPPYITDPTYQCVAIVLPWYNSTLASHVQPLNILQQNGQLSNITMTITYRALCGMGMYESSNVCVPCPQGTFSTAVGALCNSTCVACAPGAWQAINGSTSCQLCLPGFFQPNSGSTGCSQCSPGTFSNVFGEVQCVQCAAGTYTNTFNQTICSACTQGSFQPSQNSTGCLPCTVGYYADTAAQVVCKACAPGYFNAINASSTCSPCLQGTFSKDSNASTCQNCVAGSYSNAQAWSVDCQLCAPGRYLNTSVSNTVCFACEPGTEQADAGSANCTECDVGLWSLAGASQCQKCSVGSYSLGGVSSCVLCDAGFFQDQTASSSCTGCFPGSWNRDPGSSSCFGCDVGDYSNSSNATRCFPCPAGSYSAGSLSGSSSASATSCVSCGVGQYQPSTGQSGCLECPVGRIGTVNAAADCVDCEMGSVTGSLGSTACTNCTVGTFQSGEGQSVCNDCETGQYADFQQASSCEKCPAGRRSVSLAASSACVDCEYGKVSGVDGATECTACEPGKFSNTTGQTLCLDCELGYFLANNTVQTCVACPLGSFTPTAGASSCQGCPVGTFSSGGGGGVPVTCQSCPRGKFAESVGSTSCQNCSVGNFSSGSGFSECTMCSTNQVASYEGSTSCVRCNMNSFSNAARSLCLCSAGFYGVADLAGAIHCQQCTIEMVCTVSGLMDYEVGTAPGWWRPNNNFQYLRCPNEQFCLGGVGDLNLCLPHHLGPLCGLCEAGYQSAGGGACAACDSRSSNLAQASLVFIVMVLLAALGFYLVLRMSNLQSKHISTLIAKDEATTKESIKNQLAQYNTQDVAAQAHDDLVEEEEFTTDSPETYDTLEAMRRSKESMDSILGHSSMLSFNQSLVPLSTLLKTRQTPNFVFKVKIMVGFFQIAAILPAQGGIQWPKHFVDFITIFSFFNFDFMPWQSLGCVATIDYYDKVLIVGCTPFVVLVLLLLFFYIPVMVKDETSIEDQLEKQYKHARTTRQLVKLLLFTIFLLYPFVSKTVMGVFNCVEINGNWFLLADLSLTCFSAEWSKYAYLAGFFVLCYPIGTPLIYFVLLRNNRKQLKAPTTLFMLGFLYEAYTTQCFYWELLDMFHKLALTSLIIFLPSIYQLGTSMVVLIVYLELLLWLQPYIRKGDDRFHQLVQIELYLFCLMGFMLSPPNSIDLDNATEVLVSVLLIALVVFLLSSFIIIAGRNVQKLFKQYKLARQPPASVVDVAIAPGQELEHSASSSSTSAQRISQQQQLRPSNSQLHSSSSQQQPSSGSPAVLTPSPPSSLLLSPAISDSPDSPAAVVSNIAPSSSDPPPPPLPTLAPARSTPSRPAPLPPAPPFVE